MPLHFDPEYQENIEKLMNKAAREDRRIYGFLLYLAVAFAAVFGALQAVGADSLTVISAMIAVAGLGLARIIITVGILIHINLVLNMAVVEWVGRKQLGEYEPPASGT